MIDAGATIGRFNARLGLDNSNYAQGILGANALSQTFGATFGAFVANPLLGGIVAFAGLAKGAISAGKAMVSFAAETLEGAEAIERLSQQTGVSVELIQAMQKRLEIAGYDAEKAGTGLKVFTRTIAEARQEGSPFAEILDELNVRFRDMDSLDTIFHGVMDGLYGIEDAGRRAYLASKLFGEEDSFSIVNAIGGGGAEVDKMIDQYTKLGHVIDSKSVNAMANLNTSIGITNQAIEGIKLNLMRQFLAGIAGDADLSNEGILKLAESINTQLGPVVRDLGQTVTPLINDLGPVLIAVAEYIRDITDGVRTLDDLYQNSAIQKLVELWSAGGNAIGQGAVDLFSFQQRSVNSYARFVNDPAGSIGSLLD